MNINELTVDQVIGLNKTSIDLHNKRKGTYEVHNLIRPDVLASTIGGIFIQIQHGYAHLPLERMAGLLLARVAQAQAFENGNKRTAVLALKCFLYNHGLRIKCDTNEVMTLLHGIANKTHKEDDAIQFVFDNILPRN